MNWTFFPSSHYAKDVARLWWTMFGVASLVWLAVVVAVLRAVLRHRRTTSSLRSGQARGTEEGQLEPPYLGEESPATRKAIFAAFLATVAILFFFMSYDFVLGRETPQHQHEGGMDVTVQSHQWWWEFVYNDSIPDKRFVVANELHVPVGVRVNLSIESSDVIHSVWAPRLAGKSDAVPGYRGALSFTADTAGVYGGVCAEFCGAQHAKMRFTVVAHEPRDFANWVASQRAPAIQPTDSLALAGQKVFLSGACATCHAIAGTPAFATNGPNLTHVGTRRDLAAGALPNTHDDMLRWIYNPQSIKPGTQMPATGLKADQLEAVVAYLRSLK
jgi:cytochrome c oxidase subunit 2